MNIPVCIDVSPRLDFTIVTGRNAHDVCSKHPDLAEAIHDSVQIAVRRWLRRSPARAACSEPG